MNVNAFKNWILIGLKIVKLVIFKKLIKIKILFNVNVLINIKMKRIFLLINLVWFIIKLFGIITTFQLFWIN